MAGIKITEKLRQQAKRVIAHLKKMYPDAQTALHHANPLQLLVATILSAQCTDARVNQVTPALFKKYPDANALAQSKRSELEQLIRSTGFYKNKAKSIQGASQVIVEKYQGSVPHTIEELVQLPGVGRKTANVVLGNAFDTPGLVVDTHVGRISRRLGFTKHKDPVKVEFELMKLIAKKDWVIYSHLLILHGRAVCKAPTPICSKCDIGKLCPSQGMGK